MAAPAVQVPAPVLPEGGGAVPDLVQADPPGRLAGSDRIAIAGFLAGRPHWDGVICVIGPDLSQWVQISADEVVSFQGCVTGRLLRLLGGADTADAQAVADTLSRPERLAARLRSAEVAGDAAALTGALIGAELAAAKPYWLGQRVGLIGTAAAHAAALQAQGVSAEQEPAEAMQAAGLQALAGRAGG